MREREAAGERPSLKDRRDQVYSGDENILKDMGITKVWPETRTASYVHSEGKAKIKFVPKEYVYSIVLYKIILKGSSRFEAAP